MQISLVHKRDSFVYFSFFFAEKFGKSEIIRNFATNHWRMASAEVAKLEQLEKKLDKINDNQ